VRFPKSPIGDAPATTRAARNHPRGKVTSLLSSLSIGYLGITLARAGGTTYTFVTDGIESALAQAQAVAGDRDVVLGGGTEIVRQVIRAGLLDEIRFRVVS
jgi:hypothetical protein